MTKIKAKLETSETAKSFTFNFHDLDVTKEEWEAMSDTEKHNVIQNAVFELNEQPYWVLDTFEED